MYSYDQFTKSEREQVWKAIRIARTPRAKVSACCAVLAKIRKEHDDPDIALCFYAEPRVAKTGQATMSCKMYKGSAGHRICVSPRDRFGTIKCPEYLPMKTNDL